MFAQFTCQHCGGSEFQLQVNPAIKASVQVCTLPNGSLEIAVGERRFLADLGFMNQCALCQGCHGHGQWQYAINKGL